VLALLLTAGSLGLSNFAASVAIGLSGVNAGLRLRVGLAFGLFEAGMPVLGVWLGRRASSRLGSHANLLAGGLLVAVGLFTMLRARRADRREASSVHEHGTGRLLLLAAALSIDNLIVGFALGAYNVPLAAAIVIIAVVSLTLSLVGLEIGARLGARIGEESELLSGAVLVAVGAAIAAGVL
jgi:manganese efflux pump family protein